LHLDRRHIQSFVLEFLPVALTGFRIEIVQHIYEIAP
jgi:hypothetical protein